MQYMFDNYLFLGGGGGLKWGVARQLETGESTHNGAKTRQNFSKVFLLISTVHLCHAAFSDPLW